MGLVGFDTKGVNAAAPCCAPPAPLDTITHTLSEVPHGSFQIHLCARSSHLAGKAIGHKDGSQ